MTSRALRTGAFAALLLLAAGARAEGPPPPAAPPVPDVVFRAVLDRPVELQLRDGGTVSGKLLSVEPDNAVIALGDGRVVALPRAEVLEVRLAPPPPPVPDLPALPAPGEAAAPAPGDALAAGPALEDVSGRRFGIQFGLGPGVLTLDYDHDWFYGFVSGSLALPLFTVGDTSAAGVTLAPGVTFELGDAGYWHFDLFAHASIGFFGSRETVLRGGQYREEQQTDVDTSIGVGMGFHYTGPSGFTVGFKLPILGFGFGRDIKTLGQSGAAHYLNALVSFPLATVGYRF